MNAFWRRGATFLFVLAFSIPAPSSAATLKGSETASLSDTSSGSGDYIEPQIVRLTHVERDVRLSAGDGKGAIGKNWVQALPGIAIEQGYTVATGAGRAEIELEDGSLIYLADNSTLLFEELDVYRAPLTRVLLVNGSAVLDAHPLPSGEFAIEVPSSNRITITPPESIFLRVDSYVDGMAVTPLQDTAITNAWSLQHRDTGPQKIQLRAGQTVVYHGPSASVADPATLTPPDEFDQWAKSRAALRQSDLAAALKASGLSEPVPGLIELYKTGSFSSCVPHGTCWQPSLPAESSPQSSSPSPQAAPPNQLQSAAANQSPANLPPKPATQIYSYGIRPCVSQTETVNDAWDPKNKKWVEQYQYSGEEYWDWTLCRAGSWIHREHGFVLVLHNKKHHPHHHHPPVCWVRVGGKTGFVPRNPADKKGKPPINLKYGLFVPSGKGNEPAKLVQVDSSRKVAILDDPPKNFREVLPILPAAQRPVIDSRTLAGREVPAKSGAAEPKEEKSAILYDYGKSRFKSSGVVSSGSAAKSALVAKLDFRGAGSAGWSVWSGIRVSNPGGAAIELVRSGGGRSAVVIRGAGGSSLGGGRVFTGGTRSGSGSGSGGSARSTGSSGGGGGYSGGGGYRGGAYSGGGGGGYSGGGSSGGGSASGPRPR
ncbi:MAG TPA: FecR family protein [Candidatus Aquilonibacter sp.]|nr:FecR family protein [Candidatus Aquilonibacter sp.]